MQDEFRAQVEGNTIEIAINRSRMDASCVGRFKDCLQEAWKEGLERAVVDMGVVEFIDSSGVGALLGVMRRLPQGEATVVLKSMRPQVVSVIELLRLHRVFGIAA